MKTQPKNRQFREESIEAKPLGGFSEPTTFDDQIKELWKDMMQTTKDDLIGGTGESIFEQILGGGELAPGEEVSLAKKQAQEEASEKKPQVTSEFMEYSRSVTHAERIGETQVERQISQAVEEIRMEIKKLTATSKLVERTVKDATADQAPVKPGKYHINFFEFVLNILKDATRKLEDSVSYGALFQSKKQQSHFWKMANAKKGGTSFMLSGERTSATQTG